MWIYTREYVPHIWHITSNLIYIVQYAQIQIWKQVVVFDLIGLCDGSEAHITVREADSWSISFDDSNSIVQPA